MISIELSVKHMAWANQEIFKEVKKLGPEVLDYYVIDPEWTVKTIMVHIVGASYLYGKRLQQKELSRIEFDIESPDLIDNLLSELEIIDKNLIEQVQFLKVTSNFAIEEIKSTTEIPLTKMEQLL